jgi:hypothetical protein
MNLYRVSLKVRPVKEHPMFWEVEFGTLHVWLWGDTPEDAGERAVTIVEQLPYERFGKTETWQESWPATVRLAESHKPTDPPEFEKHYQEARSLGIGICLDFCPTGIDEAGFESLTPR